VKIYDKLRGHIFPFVLIGAFLIYIPIGIFKVIKEFFYNNQKEILLSLGILLFVIPIVYSLLTGWELHGFFMFYDFIFVFIVVIWLIGLADSRQYERDGGGYNGYQSYNNIEKNLYSLF